MILVIYGIAKYCLRLSQKNAWESERNTRGKIMQVIMLANDKNVFLMKLWMFLLIYGIANQLVAEINRC